MSDGGWLDAFATCCAGFVFAALIAHTLGLLPDFLNPFRSDDDEH